MIRVSIGYLRRNVLACTSVPRLSQNRKSSG